MDAAGSSAAHEPARRLEGRKCWREATAFSNRARFADVTRQGCSNSISLNLFLACGRSVEIAAETTCSGEMIFGGGSYADFVLRPDHFSVDVCNFFAFVGGALGRSSRLTPARGIQQGNGLPMVYRLVPIATARSNSYIHDTAAQRESHSSRGDRQPFQASIAGS